MSKPLIYIVVPVFNEAPNIAALFEAFSSLDKDLKDDFTISFVLVDDGSSDDTPRIARQAAGSLDLTMLQHEVNKGPGAAFAGRWYANWWPPGTVERLARRRWAA